MKRLRWIALAAVAVAGCGGQVDGSQDETLPPDPGLAYESEPDPFAVEEGGTDENEGVYSSESCSLHSGWANGNYTRLTQYQVA